MSDQPKNDTELKDMVTKLLREARHERGEWDGAITRLNELIDGRMSSAARHIIEDLARKEPLEFKWKIETLLEDTAPPEPPKPEPVPDAAADAAAETAPTAPPEPAPELPADPGVVAPLRPEDLIQVFDDPRGLMIHRHAIDGRWFLTQVDPSTEQPQTMELDAAQRGQVQQELAGNPGWIEKEWDLKPAPTSSIIS
ncbi:MAG: hypothetical protein ACI9KE_001168 [Polyangiales bacterium]|jgi:hypothetical protein